MTAVADDIGAAFEAALAKDAGTSPPPEVPAPPRIPERDPAAPHGRADDGSPKAPFGLKSDGTPRLKPAGPGRPRADDKPRVTAAAAPSAGKPADKPDYTEALMGLGTAVWLGASSIRGGKLGPVRLPDCRPMAMAWRQQLPQLAAAWNAAAQQNTTVRGYVENLTGDGGKSWVIGVAVTGASFVGSCIELARAPKDVRDQWAAANDAEMEQFIKRQVEAAGLEAQ